MSDQTDFEAEIEAVSTPAASGVSQPTAATKPAVDWKAKYDGLKGYAKQVADERDQLKSQNTATVEQDTARIEDLSSRLTVAQAEAARAKTLEAELNPLKAKVTVLDTLIGTEKYRPLVDWYGDGLLRPEGLEGELLTQYLDKALTRVQTTGQQAQRNFQSGATPPAPISPETAAVPGATSIQELNKQMSNALRLPGGVNSADYRALKMQWEEMVHQGKHK